MADDKASSERPDSDETRALKRSLLVQQLDLEPKKFRSETRKAWFGLASGVLTASLVPIALTLYEGYSKRQAEAKAAADRALDQAREDQRAQADIAQKDKDAKNALFASLAPLVLGKNADPKNCPLVLEVWSELRKDDSTDVFAKACPGAAAPAQAPLQNEWAVLAASSPEKTVSCANAKKLSDAGYSKVLVFRDVKSLYVVIVGGYLARTQAEQAAVSLRSMFGPGIVLLLEHAVASSAFVSCDGSGAGTTKP